MKKIEEFIRKSIAEPDNDEGLYHEQLLHYACQEVWDDLLEENVLDDLDESNFPGAMETDPESFNRSILINWLLLSICYWWTYCNIADRGIEIFLKFFNVFFSVLSERIPWMALFAASFPSSLYVVKKYFGLHKDCFIKFVVCPKCNSLYNYDSAYEKVGGRRLSRKYSFVEFPNHRQRAHRKSCNEILLKEVKLQDGKLKLYHKKVYCYNSFIETLKTFSPTPWTVVSKREDQHTKFIPVQRIQCNFVATVQKWKGENDLFLSRNSVKTSFGVGRLLAKV